jgi:hypothetical protein
VRKGGAVIVAVQKRGLQVSHEMIYCEQRNSSHIGQGFSKLQSHQKGAHEPRARGHRHALQLPQGHSGRIQRGVSHWNDVQYMVAGRQLRDHTPVLVMDIHLGRDHVAVDSKAVIHHSGGGLVAGALDAKYQSAGHGYLLEPV